MKAGSTAMTQRTRVPSGSILAPPDPRRLDRERSTHKFLMITFFDITGMIYIYWVPNEETVNKEYYIEVLREFRKRFRRKRPALFKLGQWHFHQDNAPVHNSILVTEYLTNMGIKTVPQPPYSPEHAPCDFCLFPQLRGCRYVILRTGAVVEFRRSQGWKTREHISCHRPLGTWVIRYICLTIKNVTNLARAGRVTCRVQAKF